MLVYIDPSDLETVNIIRYAPTPANPEASSTIHASVEMEIQSFGGGARMEDTSLISLGLFRGFVVEPLAGVQHMDVVVRTETSKPDLYVQRIDDSGFVQEFILSETPRISQA